MAAPVRLFAIPHADDCRCDACEPAPSPFAMYAVAGLLIGNVLVAIIDHVIDGPGAFAIFGL